MKIKYCILTLLSFLVLGCAKDYVPESDDTTEVLTRAGLKEGQVFYYYGYEDRKIFLDQVTDKVYVKFAPNATKEQFRSVVTGNASLRPMDANADEYFVEGYPSNGVVLEGREMMFSDFLNSFKAKDEVVSVTYLLEYNGVGLSAYTDEFIVKLEDGTSYAQLQELADKNNCATGKENEFVKNQYMLYVSKVSELDAMQTANLFYETGLFEFAEPNLIFLNSDNSNDQFFTYQWGLKNTGQYGGTSGIDIKAEQAWAITKGSSNIRIAVVESGGVELTHPDLQGNMLAGYDASGHGTGGGPYNSADNHGTAVAGIIAALQNNIYQGSYEGISGVAPNCKIVPIKAGRNGAVNSDWAATSINWVANNNKAEVINCSWGSNGTVSTNLRNAINNAVTNGRGGKGCIVVAAAGNDNLSTVSSPANLPNVIAVGAIDRYGHRAGFSNYGTALDVVAPGGSNSIYTTDRQGSAGYSSTDYTASFDGTSAAAPHVSGIAALILSVRPDLTQRRVTDIIESTCKDLGRLPNNNGWNNEVGHGLVNAYDALVEASTIRSNATLSVISTGPMERYAPIYIQLE